MSKIKLGIIGIGNMGSNYATRIVNGECPDFELVAVADINPKRLVWAQENLQGSGNLSLFNTAEELLDSGLVEACMIETPHYDHPRYAMECMKRGIHVMIDKPAGVYTKQVREMNECAAAHPEVVFGVMFNQRTNCVYKKMRELIQSGKYGNIRRTNWIITNWYPPQVYYDSGNWRATWAGEGGGVLLNQSPHQLDLWQWICGMPKKVFANMQFGKWHDIEVEDDVTCFVEYENGATGTFITTTGDACGTNRFEVQLDRAKLLVEDDKLRVWEFEMTEQEFSKTCTTPFGSMKIEEVNVELDGSNPQHTGVINAWGRAILEGAPLIADGAEGINGLMLSNAMHLSGFTGQPVELPFDEDLFYEELQKRVKSSKKKDHVVEITAKMDQSWRR